MGDESANLIESNERLFRLVTEGLRAGPGTVEWEEALKEVGAVEAVGGVAKEMELLRKVRRHLEAGSNWREISAGEGFTRKLMGAIEAEEDRKSPKSMAFWIAGIAITVIVGIAVWVALAAMRDHPADGNATGTGTAVVAYGSPVWVWDFGQPWPARTAMRGGLKPLSTGEGIRLVKGDVGPDRLGVAMVSEVELGALGAAVVEATFEIPGNLDPSVVTQVFLTSSPSSADSQLGVTEREWVWQLSKDGVAVVTPNMEVAKLSDVPTAGSGRSGTVVVRMELLANGEIAVSANGGNEWKGKLGLEGPATTSPSSPGIYVGVRFLAKGNLRSGLPLLKQIRVLSR